MANGFDLSLVAARPALLAGKDNIVDVLIRVQAPDAPKSGLPERPRLNLAIVIDRSGSMSGQPLHEAKRAASFMIDSLKATDRASVVTYDDEVAVVAPSRHVEGARRISSRRLQRSIRAAQRTCMAVGSKAPRKLQSIWPRNTPAGCSFSPMGRPTRA
jgi:Mg-chelatase subunit ChlD